MKKVAKQRAGARSFGQIASDAPNCERVWGVARSSLLERHRFICSRPRYGDERKRGWQKGKDLDLIYETA